MLQYILTGLAGIVLGVVAMRVWQAREGAPGADAPVAAEAAVETGQAAGAGSSRKLLIGAGVLVAVAVAVLALRGTGQTGTVQAPASAAASDQQLADVDTMIAKLSARLEKEPNDGEGFRMLGWSYLMTGRPQLAIAPFKRALELLPKQATVHSGYGEALVGVAGGNAALASSVTFAGPDRHRQTSG